MYIHNITERLLLRESGFGTGSRSVSGLEDLDWTDLLALRKESRRKVGALDF